MTEPHPDGISPDQANPEEVSQVEIEQAADGAGDDPVTRREALETDLMAQGESDAGEEIGDPTP